MRAIVAACRRCASLPVLRALLGAGAVAGVALTAYAAREARQFTLRRVDVPILPPGQRPLRVLHLSDIHMTPGQRAQAGVAAPRWPRSRRTWSIDTGDNLAHRDAVPVVRDSLGALLERPGRVRARLQRLLRARRCATRCATCCPTTAGGTSGSPPLPWARPDRGRSPAPAGSTSPTAGRRWSSARRRSRSPASTTRTSATTGSTEVRGPADPDGRRAARDRARAVPPGAGPVRRRRVRRGARRPHPRRPGVPAGRPGAHHQLRPRAGPGPRPAPPPRRLAPGRSRARRGCTSRPGSAPAPTPGSGSTAAPRPPC